MRISPNSSSNITLRFPSSNCVECFNVCQDLQHMRSPLWSLVVWDTFLNVGEEGEELLVEQLTLSTVSLPLSSAYWSIAESLTDCGADSRHILPFTAIKICTPRPCATVSHGVIYILFADWVHSHTFLQRDSLGSHYKFYGTHFSSDQSVTVICLHPTYFSS